MDFPMNDRPLLQSALLKKIQALREQLIHIGLQEGLSNEKTIHLSQKLDEYIYLYQKSENHENSATIH